jgi:hypothetical protein
MFYLINSIIYICEKIKIIFRQSRTIRKEVTIRPVRSELGLAFLEAANRSSPLELVLIRNKHNHKDHFIFFSKDERSKNVEYMKANV